jgi:ABC transporter DrrB family efflux protein
VRSNQVHDTSATLARRHIANAAVRDVVVMSRRNLRRVQRTPQLLAFSSVLPISFTLLFYYVLGGSVSIAGESYIDYLVPTMLVLAPLFGATTAIAMADDMNGGMIDRFRSLPIARSAVLAGRTVADLARVGLVIALVLATGLFLGFNFNNTLWSSTAAIGLVLAFSFAMSWVMAWVGLKTKEAQTASVAVFLPIFLMTFAGAGVVPIQSLPGWLQAFAKVQPISVTIEAVRGLTQGGPIAHHLWQAIAWTVGILAVFVPLAINESRRV